MKNQLKEINLNEIKVSDTNPRKTFDEGSLKELSHSIQDKGVLQPILVRPIDANSDLKEYELVCGERRYRASIMAGLTMIPANIRELDDDEAFEMQIIENLERKDVHPLEESEAFNKMLKSEKYTIADIAAKFAKPETFIVQRLKFVDLIDELKKDFFDGKFGIGHAVLLARLDAESQKEQFDEANNEGGWNEGYGTIEELKRSIEGDLYNLDDAPFDTNDDTFTAVSSCLVCPKRSGANKLLFPDVEEDDICHDRSCYHKKLNQYLERKVADIINNGEDIHLGLDWNSKAPDFISEMCKQNNVPILSDEDWGSVWNEEEKKKAPKMLLVGGSDIGQIKPIVLRKSATSKGVDGVEPTVQQQIEKIEARAKRALELDDEKVWNTTRNFGDGDIGITLEKEKFFENGEPLSEKERMGLIVAIRNSISWDAKSEVEFIDEMNMERVKSFDLPEDVLNRALRLFIYDKLNISYGSHTTSFDNQALFQILEEHFPNEISGIKFHFEKKADKRIARTEERLEKLKTETKK